MTILGESQRILEVKSWGWTQRPGCVPLSRAVLRKWLTAVGAERFEEDATLCFSELLTNAIRIPSPNGFTETAWLLYSDRLRIEIRDYSPEAPYVSVHDSECESGRGLFLVHLLADKWGYEHTSFRDENGESLPGKTVWFELHN